MSSPSRITDLPQAPAARREHTLTTIHGVTLQDDFRWLRQKDSPEVLDYLSAENAYTAAYMAPTEALQKALYDEMLSHIKETDESVPYRFGDWFYFTRTLEGSQYSIHSRRPAHGPASVPSMPDPADPEQVILDVNQLAEGKPFMSLGALAISPDGNLLAYSTDDTGYRQYTLHIRRYDPALGTWADLPDTALRVGSIAWAADSRTLFYTTEDETTKRHDHLLRHTLGTPLEQDVLVMFEEDARFNLGIGKTRDGLYLLIESGSHTTNEYRFLRADTPTAPLQLLAPRIDEQEYYPDHRAAGPGKPGLFFIRTNDAGKNFRVVTAPVSAPGRDHWQEFIPLDPAHPLEDLDLFQTFAVATRRKAGLPTLEVLRFTDSPATEPGAPSMPQESAPPPMAQPGQPDQPGAPFMAQPHRDMSGVAAPAPQSPTPSQEIASSRGEAEASLPHTQPTLAPPVSITFPEPTYSASAHINRIFSSPVFRYSYTSLVSPPSVYEYNVCAADYPVPIGQSQLLKQQEVPGGFDPANYASERVWINAPAGIQPDGSTSAATIPIPVSIVYRRDLRDATNPLYLYGYGSYGYPLPVSFSPSRLALLDRGVVMAYAHIRGGGELGDAWHDAGKMQQKMNTFTDFLAAAEQLPAKGFGSPSRIAIEGGSAGGLLMGAVTNLAAAPTPGKAKPNLFRVVLSHVPFVDVINTMLDASLPLTVAEYEEWGNPNEPEAFRTMLAYSPYDQAQPGPYPAMLVKTSLNDSQVMYWEPAKYVARLRLLKTNNPTTLTTPTEQYHPDREQREGEEPAVSLSNGPAFPPTPLLLHTNMEAGHGGASGRYDYLKEIAFDFAFLLTQLGVL